MAIAANELRHGSWYFFERYGEGKLWINDDYTFYIEFPNQSNEMLSKFSYSQIKPIPLSPEILIDCGFETSLFVKQITEDGWQICLEETDNWTVWYGKEENWKNRLPLCDVNSLHQLQNIYFALTGKELEYKP